MTTDAGGPATDPENEFRRAIRARIWETIERQEAQGYYPVGGTWRASADASRFYEEAKRQDRQRLYDTVSGLAVLVALVLFLWAAVMIFAP